MEKVITHPRGAIYFVNIEFTAEESKGVQTGNRPCVVISSDTGNTSSDSVMIALITSKDKANKGINVPFVNWNGEENVVLCNQIHTVSKKWLTNKCFGILPSSIMKEVDKQLAVALNISRNNIDISEITQAVNKIIEARKAEMIKEKQPITQKVVGEIASSLEKLFVDVLVPMEKEAKAQQKEEVIKSAPVLTAYTNAEIKEAKEAKETAKTEEIKSENDDEDKVEKLADTFIDTDEHTEIKEDTKSKTKRPKGFWTEEKMMEFIHDKEKMPLSELKKKWEIEKSPTVYQMYYTYKKKLGLK